MRGHVVAFAVDLAGDAQRVVVGAAVGVQAGGELAAAAADPAMRGVGH